MRLNFVQQIITIFKARRLDWFTGFELKIKVYYVAESRGYSMHALEVKRLELHLVLNLACHAKGRRARTLISFSK